MYIDPIKQDRDTENVSSIDNSLQRVEINPVELCNRTCVFCPRSDPNNYPNQNLHMSLTTAINIGTKLNDFGYSGRITFSGFGEPLLHRDIYSLIKAVTERAGPVERTQLITNGDKLNSEVVDKLYTSGISKIEVDMYDGEHQVEYFEEIFKSYEKTQYMLRHHYYSKDKDYGLTLNNRAGSVKLFKPLTKPITKKCYLPFYKLMIDWNGDVLLCCQDWKRAGNVNMNINTDSIEDIWFSDQLNRYREKLSSSDRSLTPCNTCNIGGTLNGIESYNKMNEHYKFNKNN